MYNTDLIASGRLVFIGNYPQHQPHSLQKQRVVFHLKVCQLLAISYYNGMTRYEVGRPFPPSPEEQCKGRQELSPALDNNKSWVHWPHSMQAEKYLFIFLKSFSVTLPYLVNSWTGSMISKTISSTPISTPIVSVLQATFGGKKKKSHTQTPQLKYLFW